MQRSAKIIRLIESEILEGKMPVGQRLDSEEKLCERFGVSRTVIREAIQQLRGRGLLRTLKGSGTYIAESNLDTLANAVEAYSALAEDLDFLELIDFRIMIETECARLAAIHVVSVPSEMIGCIEYDGTNPTAVRPGPPKACSSCWRRAPGSGRIMCAPCSTLRQAACIAI